MLHWPFGLPQSTSLHIQCSSNKMINMHFGRIFNSFLLKSMCLNNTCLPCDTYELVKTSLNKVVRLFTSNYNFEHDSKTGTKNKINYHINMQKGLVDIRIFTLCVGHVWFGSWSTTCQECFWKVCQHPYGVVQAYNRNWKFCPWLLSCMSVDLKREKTSIEWARTLE